MQPTYIEPTKAGRIRIVKRSAGFVSLLVLLLILVYVVVPRYIRTLPQCEMLSWHRGEMVAIAIFVIAVGMFLLVQNWRALREGQWPPSRSDVLVRVKIIRGRRLWFIVANTVAYWMIAAWATSMVGLLIFAYFTNGSNACNA